MCLTIEHERGELHEYRPCDDDGLGFFRGCMFALLIGLAMWTAVVLIFVL